MGYTTQKDVFKFSFKEDLPGVLLPIFRTMKIVAIKAISPIIQAMIITNSDAKTSNAPKNITE